MAENAVNGGPDMIRVLVVDDSFFMRKLIVEALEAPGSGIKNSSLPVPDGKKILSSMGHLSKSDWFETGSLE